MMDYNRRSALIGLLIFPSICLSAPIVWVKVTEPMEHIQWAQVEDQSYIEDSCKSDRVFPRVCLYRHLSKCRIITLVPPSKIPPKTKDELFRMCGGYFPEPILLRRKFSDPNYLPNQAPPSVDPTWAYQNKE